MQLMADASFLVYLNGDTLGSTSEMRLSLNVGVNDLLIRLDGMPFALKLETEASVTIHLPTSWPQPEYRQQLAQRFALTYLAQTVFFVEDTFTLHHGAQSADEVPIVVRLQSPDGKIHGEISSTLKPHGTTIGVRAIQMPEGVMEAVIMPSSEAYAEQGIRVKRTIPFYVSHTTNVKTIETTYNQRIITVVQKTAQFGDEVPRQLALMVGRWWEDVDVKRLIELRRQTDDALTILLLLGMQTRFAGGPNFPAELQSLDWVNATNFDQIEPQDEITQLVIYANRLLVAQLRGEEIDETTRDDLLDWLVARGRYGFASWNVDIDALVTALSNLADLIRDDEVREVAAILLDKVLFLVMVQSSAHAQTGFHRVPSVEEDLKYLVAQQGAFSSQGSSALSLAITRNYLVPQVISDIGRDQREKLWSVRHDQGTTHVLYQTPQVALASVQNDRHGEADLKARVWQATLGHGLRVFTQNPRILGTWQGEGALPNVGQWQDTLIALYQLQSGTGVRAYFPTPEFDDYRHERHWAFAQVGSSYIGLYASTGFGLTQTGCMAQRELWAQGQEQVWVCLLGQESSDGDFQAFVQKVQALDLSIDALNVEMTTLRGERLSFGWVSPFKCNNDILYSGDMPHIHNPYCDAAYPADSIDIRYKDDGLRLDFV